LKISANEWKKSQKNSSGSYHFRLMYYGEHGISGSNLHVI
jgi:hypothetical protein